MRSAAIVIIGSEIISGRTQDLNIQFLAHHLDGMGISLGEVRIIPDLTDMIVKTINQLKVLYDYIITTGGIGPTHDDITALSIAKAFNLKIVRNQQIVDVIYNRNPQAPAASYRMADIPEGAILIENPLTLVPGFQVENVYVLAGIPSIMQSMFLSLKDKLEKGRPTLTKTVNCALKESNIADGLAFLQSKFDHVDIGSYPYKKDGLWELNVVLRSKEENSLNLAVQDVENLINDLGGTPKQI